VSDSEDDEGFDSSDDFMDNQVENEEDDPEAAGIWAEDEPFAGNPAGTLHLLAPECLHHHGTTASDYWSLGVMIFRLCSGCYPFQHGTHG